MKTVLVIDDSSTNIKAAKRFLETIPELNVLSASNGAEGVSVFLDHDVDLIFLDIEMPLLNGYETALVIKDYKDKTPPPIIMVSSRDGVFDTLKGKMYKAEEYITKPYKKEDLVNMVKKYLHIEVEE